MKEVKLTNSNKVALVDDEDFERVSKFNWYEKWHSKSNTPYAESKVNGRTMDMQRFILQLIHGDKKEVDHKNHYGLDNQRKNLRVATRSQNMANSKVVGNRYSKYKGVNYRVDRKTWQAKIMQNYKGIHLGTFKNEIDAAKAYDKKAYELFGSFARLNFPFVDATFWPMNLALF